MMERSSHAQDFSLPRKMAVVVRGARYLTDNIKEFEIEALDGSTLPPFVAGAHIDVLTGTKFYRSYSLVNHQDERHRYIIAVKYEQAGKGGSQFMHNFVDVGEKLTIRTPSNLFSLREDATYSILIAGGIGVTPIICMARRLRQIGASFELHYLGRALDEMAYHTELAEFAPEQLRLHVTGDGAVSIPAIVPAYVSGSHLYVCGPSGLIEAVRQAATGWPSENIHFELFSNSLGPREIAEPAEPFDVKLARSGRVITVPKDQTLLQALLASGVDIASNCENGICGTCTVALLAGEADHRDSVLGEERRKRCIQTCVSRARSGQHLVIDC